MIGTNFFSILTLYTHTQACPGVVGRPRVVDVVVGVAPLALPSAADDDAHDALAEYHQ